MDERFPSVLRSQYCISLFIMSVLTRFMILYTPRRLMMVSSISLTALTNLAAAE